MLLSIEAEKIVGRDLKPGDLFSPAGPDYWQEAVNRGSRMGLPIGEKVYIRTDAEAPPGDNTEVYRITIHLQEASDVTKH